jgi:hypothetical protein
MNSDPSDMTTAHELRTLIPNLYSNMLLYYKFKLPKHNITNTIFVRLKIYAAGKYS